ncbi:MAG: DinB family protein [Ginsengibacter sp.]
MDIAIFREIEHATDELIDLLSSSNEKELNEIPFEGSWTAAQVAEHLLKSYGIVEILKAPQTKTERLPDEKAELLKSVFLNFSQKVKSAAAILPSDDFIKKEELISALNKKVSEIKEIIQTQDLSEICESIALPMFGALTKLEWLYLILYHIQRHIHQIKNIFQTLKTNKNEISKSLSEF